jgi:hypothetical protein
MGSKTTAIVLDVVELPKSHTGDNMAEVIAAIVSDYGIGGKVSIDQLRQRIATHLFTIQVLNITLDNASNNDRLIKKLPELVQSFAGEAAQVRCFNHVINLTARMIVRQFDVPKKNADDVLKFWTRILN